MNEIQIAEEPRTLSPIQCQAHLSTLDDALYVIGGKWKLRIIMALRHLPPTRFNELQRSVTGISARVLSNELKQLELNGFVVRTVDEDSASITYHLTDYSDTLHPVLDALTTWGAQHRKKILGK